MPRYRQRRGGSGQYTSCESQSTSGGSGAGPRRHLLDTSLRTEIPQRWARICLIPSSAYRVQLPCLMCSMCFFLQRSTTFISSSTTLAWWCAPTQKQSTALRCTSESITWVRLRSDPLTNQSLKGPMWRIWGDLGSEMGQIFIIIFSAETKNVCPSRCTLCSYSSPDRTN